MTAYHSRLHTALTSDRSQVCKLVDLHLGFKNRQPAKSNMWSCLLEMASSVVYPLLENLSMLLVKAPSIVRLILV